MFSRILVKLIDQALLPAILLLTTRVVSTVLYCKQLGIVYTITSAGFTFSNPADYIKVNSFSTAVMICVLALGLTYSLLKSYIFHDSHIEPSVAAHTFSVNMHHFIQNSFELYVQGAIWISYLILMTLVSGLMAFFGLMYSWVFVLSLVLLVLTLVLLILDIEYEMTINRSKEAEEDTSEVEGATVIWTESLN